MLPKILIVIVIVVVGFLGLGFVSMKFGINPPFGIPKPQPPQTEQSHQNQEQDNQQQDYFADVSDLPSCGDKKELFALSPLSLEDFTSITPLGLLSPTAHVFPSPHLFII